MRLKISIRMLHEWFEKQEIKHECKITEEQYEIYGIRYEQYKNDQDHYAVVYDARLLRGFADYQTIIRHKDNMLLFPDSSSDLILNQANCMMSAWREWESRLKKINITKGSVEEILRQTEKVLPFPILLLRGQRIVAVSEPWSEEIRQIYMTFRQTDYEDVCREDKKGGILEELYSHRSISMVKRAYWAGQNSILCNIWIEGMCLLRLIVFAGKDRIVPCDLSMIDELAKSIGNSVRQNMEKYFRNDLTDMTLQTFFVKKTVDEESLWYALKKRKWNRSDVFLCYCIETNLNVSVFGMEKLMEELRIYNNQWCVFSTESQIIIITVPRGNQKTEKKWVIKFCAEKAGVLGISCEGRNWMWLPHYIRQAQQFSEYACMKGVLSLDGNDCRAENIYAILGENQWYQSLVYPQIRILQKEDENKSGHLCETLEIFLRNGCNQTVAASQLGIYRTTLNYRLERIRNLIGEAWETVQCREGYLLSLLIANHEKLQRQL